MQRVRQTCQMESKSHRGEFLLLEQQGIARHEPK